MCCTTTLSWKPSPLLEMKMIYIKVMKYYAQTVFQMFRISNLLYQLLLAQIKCEQENIIIELN